MAFKYVRSPRSTLYPNITTLQSIYIYKLYTYINDRDLCLSCTTVDTRVLHRDLYFIHISTTAASLLRTDRLYRKKNVPEYCTYSIRDIFFCSRYIYIYTHVSGLELSSEAYIFILFFFSF